MALQAKSRLIAVFGTKGGVGKTVVATNVAVSLAGSGVPVLLLDADPLAMGDAAKALHLSPQQSLVDLAALQQGGVPLTPAEVERFVTKHSSGIAMLPLVRHPSQTAQVHADFIKPCLDALRATFGYIVVDVGRGLSEVHFTLFDEANLLLLVVSPDILTLSQTKWALELLSNALYPAQMVKTVLNRAESRGGVATEDVRAAVACELIGMIPSDGRAVGLSINQGIPVVVSAPATKVSQAFRNLANLLHTHHDFYLEAVADPALLARRQQSQQQIIGTASAPLTGAPATSLAGSQPVDEWTALKHRIHEQLVEKLNLKKLDVASLSNKAKMQELRERTEAVIMDVLAEESGGFLASREARERLVKEVADEALGLGPLEDLLADPMVNDILVNRRDQIFVERRGKLELTDKQFTSDDHVRAVIERIVAPLGRRIDEANPMVDARLSDGSRVNAIIPPLALKGPTISIRKFSRERLTDEDLIRFGSVTPEIIRFLEACVRARKNLIISGGTGSGKTTFLNIVSSFIPNDERILTIEDAAELRLDKTHLVSLESRPPNIEGKGQITIRDLFRNALRMRPDRIVIGECRGGETLDMLQAMNTGHDGSLTTIHANSPRDVISRLDSMVLMSNIDLPVRAIREQIVSAVHVIVHTARLSDGSRKVTAISQIMGLRDNLEVEFLDLFLFHQTGVDAAGKVLGAIVPTGQLPTFLQELTVKGLAISEELFQPPASFAGAGKL